MSGHRRQGSGRSRWKRHASAEAVKQCLSQIDRGLPVRRSYSVTFRSALRLALATTMLGLVWQTGAAVAQQGWQPQTEPRPAVPQRATPPAAPSVPAQPRAAVPSTRSAPVPPPKEAGTAIPSSPRPTPAPVAPALPIAPAPGSGPDTLFGNAQVRTGEGQVTLVALLTEDGQRIEQGMVWHVFRETGAADNKQTRHVNTSRNGSATLRLPSGDYVVTASFGRAYTTRRIRVQPDVAVTEQFILNAGGLRLQAAQANGEPLLPSAISIDIYSDERDQAGNRVRLVDDLKPGIVLRLNSGIYHLVSTYGDANAQVRADVTVEAGKLTEAKITHHAARVTLKLVNRAGGDALADTQWSIATPQGIIVKESVGALPTHVLAPGDYTAVARSGGRVFRRDFKIEQGQSAQVEVVAQ